MTALTVAVNGCSHGELNVLYETLQHIETTQGIRTDVLICCGDFEAVRDSTDLDCMNV
jgi:lariat debranching enzyme